MARTQGHRTTTFIVRMWQDDGVEDGRTWRGQIEHVQSGDREFLRTISQVTAFIEQHLQDRASEARQGGIR